MGIVMSTCFESAEAADFMEPVPHRRMRQQERVHENETIFLPMTNQYTSSNKENEPDRAFIRVGNQSKGLQKNKTTFLPMMSQYTLHNKENESGNVLVPVENQSKSIQKNEKDPDFPFIPETDAEINPAKFNGPVQKPKTANKAFGSISDFALFLENRNLDVKNFGEKFKKIERMDLELSMVELNRVITPIIDECLNKMHKKIRAASNSSVHRKNHYANLFTCTFTTWTEFYKKIFHTYTINGFLYMKINEDLRNENWMELDALFPYTYCLFQAFLWGSRGQIVKENFEALKRRSANSKLTLFRGVDFDDESLKFYDPKKIKNFSWNGVISTSLIQSAVEKFLLSGSKRPILMIIEIDFEDLQPENLNAFYLASFSACPKEEEVALPPGSIFELVEINTEKEKVEMRLRLVTNAKILACQGQFLHGMLQSTMRSGKELKIVCLSNKDLSRAIKHCQGNLLIENIEFIFCNFNQRAAEVLLEVLPTLKKLASFTLNLVSFEANCNLDEILKCFGTQKIKILEVLTSLHENQVKNILNNMQSFGSLRKMKLTFAKDFQGLKELLICLSDARMQYLHPECLFEVKISDYLSFVLKQFWNNDFHKYLKQKVSYKNSSGQEIPIDSFEDRSRFLNQVLNSRQKNEISLTDEDLTHKSSEDTKSLNAEEQEFDNILQIFEVLQIKKPFFDENQRRERWNNQGLDHLQNERKHFDLTSLSLDFSSCHWMTDGDLKFLKGISFFESLTTLRLSFAGCYAMTNASLDFLLRIKNLRSLTTLHLNFQRCEKFSDESFDFLQEIWCLQSLSALHLNFNGCCKITDQGLEFFRGIKNLKSLTILHLNFGGCSNITDRGLECLGGIRYLKSLTTLYLNFERCKMLTDHGRVSFQDQSFEILRVTDADSNDFDRETEDGLYFLQYLKTLSVLSLEFSGEHQERTLSFYFLHYIQYLKSLSVLHLNFKAGMEITDEKFEFLRGIGSLECLTTLQLNFCACKRMTGTGFGFLQEMQFLKSLKTLQIYFSQCSITFSQDLEYLLNIQNLKSLTALHLELEDCNNFADADFSFFQEIWCLESLNVLHLSLRKCNQMTDDGLKSLQGIESLKSLAILDLNFGECRSITDRGLSFLQEIQYLQSLSVLNLNFEKCDKITEKSLEFLQGLKHLKLLTSLELNFKSCDEIRLEGLTGLIEATSHLQLLKTLILEFNSSKGRSRAEGEGEDLERNLINNLKSGINLFLDFGHLKNDNWDYVYPQVKDETIIFYLPRCPKWRQGFSSFQSSSNFGFFSEHLLDICVICDQDYRALDAKANYLVNNSDELPVYVCRLEDLVNLKKVRTLNFKFSSHFEMKKLTNQLIKHFSTLTDLHLDLRKCVDITDSNFKTLFHDGLQYLKSLGCLDLRFDGCFQTNKNPLEFIDWNSIKGLKSLRRIYLSFKECKNIVDESLQTLLNEGIQNFKSLTSLHLNFDGCSQITNQGLDFIGLNVIRHFDSLKILDLSFTECNKITDKGLYTLCNEVICNLKSLENLFLCIPSAGITEEFEGKTLKFDLLTSCAIIIQNRIDKTNLEGFNLKRSNIKCVQVKNENFKGLVNERVATNIVCLKKPTFKFKEKYHVFNEEILEFLELDQDLFEKWRAERSTLDTSKESRKLLQLSFSMCGDIINILLNNLFFKKIDALKSLLILNLSFYRCLDITYEELESFACQGIQHLKSLHNLQLSFEGCCSITDQGLKNFCCEGVWKINSLKSLNLAFDRCWNITDQGLKEMFTKNASLNQLQTLCLSFRECYKITNQGLENLCSEGIQYLKELQALDLHFEGQEGITNEGLIILSQQGLQHIQLLSTLNLSFIRCHQITKHGLEILLGKGVRYLKALVILNLNFKECNEISDDDFETFYYELLVELPHLHTSQSSLLGCTLSLQPTFSTEYPQTLTEAEMACTDKFWFYLPEAPSEMENNLTSLLKLDTSDDKENPLEEKRQKMLNFVTFKYENPRNIAEGDLQKMNFDEWVMLDKVKTFHFIFDGCHQIQGEDLGFRSFCQSLRRFRSVTTLHLSFDGCVEMIDEGVRNLCVEGLCHLKSLVNIHLSFKECSKISDRGMEILCHDGLSHLGVLETLYLNFDGSNKITDSGFQFFCREGISSIKSLKCLDLHFNVCDGISDEGLLALCSHAIKDLDSLTSFQFIFKNGDQITEKGLKDLISEGMPRMLKLENIQLSFPQTLKVSPNIYQAFLRILFYFGFESSSDSI